MIDDLFVPDPPTGNSSNQIANTRFVTGAISSAVASAVAGLPIFTATTAGLVPASGGTSAFLRADATFQPITSVAAASQADMEAAVSTAVFSAPGVQQFHPSAAKWWLYSLVTGGVPATSAFYNVSSIVDTAVGRLTVNFATSFSSANWVCVATPRTSSGTIRFLFVAAQGSTSVEVDSVSTVPALADPDAWHLVGFGDQ